MQVHICYCAESDELTMVAPGSMTMLKVAKTMVKHVRMFNRGDRERATELLVKLLRETKQLGLDVRREVVQDFRADSRRLDVRITHVCIIDSYGFTTDDTESTY